MAIARLEKVPLRELWQHEAHGFTHWLSENLDFVSEVIGKQLSFVEREASAGPFSADILAEDSDGNLVVIENQLEKTDHDHLGKLVTYMSNLDTKAAIWITSDPRPEHEKAIHWLNETLPADMAFYLLKIEAYKIGASDAAPHLIIVAGPNPEGKAVGTEKKELAEIHVQRLDFWKQLLEKAKSKTRLHDRISPSKDNYISASGGRSGFQFTYVVQSDFAQVELFIDSGNTEKNKLFFDGLVKRKTTIEAEFGDSLDWQRLDNRQGSRIRFVISDYGLADQIHWPDLQEKMIDAMVRLQQAIQPHIRDL